MKKVLYNPVTKFFALMLFAAGAVCTAFFAWESLAVFTDDVPSLTVLFWNWQFYVPVLLTWTVVSAIAMILLMVFLFCIAGRSPRDDETHLIILNRIPLDLYLVGLTFLSSLLFVFTHDLATWVQGDTEFAYLMYIGIIFIPACALLFAMTLMSFAARLRAKTLWRNNVITYAILLAWRIVKWAWGWVLRILRALWRGVKRVCRAIWGFVSDIPTVPLALAFIGSILLLCLFSVWAQSVFLLFLTALYAVCGILLGAIFTRRLERGADRLAKGDLECQIDTSNMFGVYKSHAENLNHIRRGMTDAVEAQIRSERMKTELITNVSHDIKTPLTSIINYVDLMKKEPIESETVREYLDIMDRQSTRLKKLIEDLIEVSKASTGNVNVELVSTDVGVLLEQALGEYRERLAATDLTLCVSNNAPNAHILADGKLLWRVFDNLLGNICKYSQPGTRVYLHVTARDNMLELTFRNISSYSLNITSEELMERFVRGDRSRHTEGSGLGLSIAKNLVELQKGKLELVIDGDLFKAIVSFPLEQS